MMKSMLSPSQSQMLNLFQNKNSEEQAEAIARMCNDKGITKEQLQDIVQMLNKR